ncbi:hypothetical protein GWC95_19365 [Sediminibacterium roseum]|uniref:Uncharacterized protein n=1 Tax=Sediminibacterium roseum TaxID=1978412 RepID=A0ABX0A1B6_9BACT|nr:hypothetical protein [Sediminibacterium roseum]NCI52093.1 hypothetical protein [Sediminibacterium roseum]
MRIFFLVSLLWLGAVNASAQFVSANDYPMPRGHSNGLVRPGFHLESKFSFVNLGKEKHLYLTLEIQLGTALNPRAPFSYRYMLMGKEYTDQDLGKEPFQSIRLGFAEFSVLVQGPNLNRTLTYKYGVKEDLGIVPQDALLSYYACHVQGLEDVDYNGTEAVVAAIHAFEDKRKAALQQSQNTARPSVSLNTQNNSNASNTNSDPSQQKKESVANNPATQTSARPKDDFWSEKKTTAPNNSTAIPEGGRLIPEQPNHKNLPEFVRTTNGGYYHKGADGRFREVTAEEYQKAKGAQSAKNTSAAPEEKQLTAAEINAKVDKMFSDARERDAAINAKIEQFGNMMRMNFYYAEAIRNGKQNLAELSTLSGEYSSIEQLQADFNRKYSAINGQVRQLEDARNAKLNNAVSGTLNGSATEQAIGQGVALIGSIFNSAKASKEAKEAKEALRLARERQEKEIIAAKQRARVEMRGQLLKSFPNGGTPLTAHKITAPEVYMFGYVIDPASINNETAGITVSNVFSVTQYSDGTYPLKTSVTGRLKGIAQGDVVLVGFYTDKNAADQMRNSFISLAQKSELSVKQFTLKTLGGSGTGNAAAASGDFWETGKSATKTAADTTKKKDGFWNN